MACTDPAAVLDPAVLFASSQIKSEALVKLIACRIKPEVMAEFVWKP